MSGSRATNKAISQPAFGELVDGVAARVWDLRAKGVESKWSSTSVGAFVSDVNGVDTGNTSVEIREEECIRASEAGAIETRKVVKSLTSRRRSSGADSYQSRCS